MWSSEDRNAGAIKDLLRLMLIVDPNKRPSASSVLTSREFLAFEKLNGI